MRKEEFKKGIHDKTRKRDEQQLSIRKEKRSEKLLVRRNADVELKTPLDALLAQFRPALLDEGHAETLHQLNQLVKFLDPTRLEKCVHRIILPHISAIVRFCETGEMLVALAILVNLTASQMEHDTSLADAIFRAGFVAQTLPRLFLKYPLGESVKMRRLAWDAVSNLALTCVEARDLLLRSPLMGFAEGIDPTVSPFARELAALYDPRVPDEARTVVGPHVIYTIAILLRHSEPPPLFCFGVWPFLQRMAVGLRAHADMDPVVRSAVEPLYNSIYYILVYEHRRDRVERLAFDPEFLPRARETLLALRQDRDLKRTIYQVVTQISGVPGSQEALARGGWIPLLIQGAEDGDPVVREISLLSAGNYATDGALYVREMMGVVPVLVRALQRERVDRVRMNAVWVFLVMFCACDVDRATHPDAEATMRAFVVEYNMFRHLLPFLTRPGTDLKMVKYALDVFCTALEWNAELIKQCIHDLGSDTITVLLDQLNNAKGSRDTALYKLACRAEDLLDGGGEGEEGGGGGYFTGGTQNYFSF